MQLDDVEIEIAAPCSADLLNLSDGDGAGEWEDGWEVGMNVEGRGRVDGWVVCMHKLTCCCCSAYAPLG